MGQLSITVAVTGLIIGGTAAGYIIGTITTGAKFLTTRGRCSIPSVPDIIAVGSSDKRSFAVCGLRMTNHGDDALLPPPKTILLSDSEKRRVIVVVVARQKIEISGDL
jgi:hypothetical protein